MNIFKVLASGKSSFQEEQASAMMAWLLNPRMEHGLGFAFLSRFVDGVAVACPNLGSIRNKLSPRLRSGDIDEIEWACHLEYNVQTAFIDIALIIDDWVLAIENKIYAGSASDPFQLKREYEGLKALPDCKDKKVGLIFLVPISASGLYDPKIETEFSNLSVQAPDFKCMIPWQMISESPLLIPSVSEMISGILDQEGKGSIEPIPEYTRHTLKAFNQFIMSGFSGYDFQSSNTSSTMNPLTEAVYGIGKLSMLNTGYVGIKGGLSGLLQIDLAKLQTQQFQYTTVDMSMKNQWLDVATFTNIADWRVNGNLHEIQWNATLRAPLLYMICKDYGSKVFIGLRGGMYALEQMDPSAIANSQWGVRMSKASNNWIEGQVFLDILKKKDIEKYF